MHTGCGGTAPRFEGYSYALVVDSRVALQDFRLQAQ